MPLEQETTANNDTLALLLENIGRAERGKGIVGDLRGYFLNRAQALFNLGKITKDEHDALRNRLYPEEID